MTSLMTSDNVSMPSFKDYPTHHPFINMHTHHPHCTHTTPPSKAFPESSHAAILSALRNLQEKIRMLERERGRAKRSFDSLEKNTAATVSHTQSEKDALLKLTQSDRDDTHKRADIHTQRDTKTETSDQPACNQELLAQLASAESRCVLLEQQLERMKRTVRNAKAERTTLLKQQVSMETARTAVQSHDRDPDQAASHARLRKLEQLEQEYLRLTNTQNRTERKIRELEIKLLEEEHQRILVQDKAKQLQTGLDEANRILLQSVSPHPPRRREKRHASKPSHTQPHYRLSLRDVPFVSGMAVGRSHSVRANVQSVLSLLKQHQPVLCNTRVLSNSLTVQSTAHTAGHSRSDGSSASSGGEELTELLQALQEELRQMSMVQQELEQQIEVCVCGHEERRELQREQENLLKRMARKGEQISKLHKHQAQMERLRREVCDQKLGRRGELRVTTTVTTRGRSPGAVRVRPGDRSQNSLRLLRDMKALQTSLRT